MKINCPFCQKELSRVDRLKYHLQHSICSPDTYEKEQILFLIDMNVSSMLEYCLDLIHKIKKINTENDEIITKIRMIENENSILRRNNDTLTKLTSANINNHDHSSHINNTNITIDNSKHITLNLFGHENVDYINVPKYLTDKYDIVNLVKDVHFNKDHPEKHNVGLDHHGATIYKKKLLNKKVLWENFTPIEALSELIQNGENILSSYSKPLTSLEEEIRQIVSTIVEKETSWNCFTEKLLGSLQELSIDFPPKNEEPIMCL